MAFFGVTIETIETISPIQDADRIEKATLVGLPFVFVIGKGSFTMGDKVLYFPIDSLLPQSLAETLGVAGKLAGKDKNRIKTIRLKSVYSQGIVGPLSLLDKYYVDKYGDDWVIESIEEITPEEITEYLGVTKYEPPEVFTSNAILRPLPCGLSAYDIEGVDRYDNVLQQMMKMKVRILEKVEGQNASVTVDGENIYCNQRNFTVIPIDGEDHTIWKIAKKYGIIDIAKQLYDRHGNTSPVTVYFECTGPSVQDNIYKLKEHTPFIFDIKVGNRFLNASEFENILIYRHQMNKYIAPILAWDVVLEEWLNGKTITDAAHGESKLYKTLREGIVITPMEEQYSPELGGRLILKKRDPIYLSKNNN